MKKVKIYERFGFFALMGLSILSVIACNSQTAPETAEELFSENPVTINWSDKSTSAESFAAEVSVYSMNNRKDSYLTKTGGYRLCYKVIDGVSYSRVDLEKEYSGGVSRAVISDGHDMVIYNNDSNEVEQRLIVPQEDNNGLDFLTASPVTGRLNIDAIRSGAKRLSLDLTEDKKEGYGVLSLPSSLFNEQEGVTRISTKVSFDLENESLDEVEVVTVDDEGVKVTTSVSNVYEEYNGEYIKIGTVTVIDTENPNKVTGFDLDYPVFESMDDIPEISEEEYAQLQAEGRVQDTEGIIFGDPSDLSNVQTTVELYSSVDINNVEDSSFRLLLGE